MIRLFLSRQFLGFIMVGGLAACLHWLSRIVLNIWLSFSLAIVLAYVVGMGVAFILNSIFVFPTSKKPKYKQIQEFIIVNLAFLPVVWAATIGLESIFQQLGLAGYAPAAAHAIAVTIPALATFVIYKLFVFQEKQYE